MRHLMLRSGLALALSVAGYVISRIRSRRAAAAGCRRRLPSASVQARTKVEVSGLTSTTREANSPKPSGNTVTLLPDSDDGPSQMNKNLEDEGRYLLPEFNELVNEEFNMTAEELHSQISHILTPPVIENDGKLEIEEEITNLRNLVESLQEREMNLELQLLECYGLKEQDAVVKELDSRLKISKMEAKLFSLKIEPLQAENKRLEAQLSDHSRVVAELESTKENIKILKKKLSSDSDQVEKMTSLQQTVAVPEGSEHAECLHDEDVERNLEKLRDLEVEAMNLRSENSKLAQANLELSERLESNQSAGSTITDTSEVNDALEEANRLRKRNEELLKELERSQMDHCTDVEELVYLRWVNACLRYELRNYQPTRCKTTAKDLSKTLSLKSEAKVKELIIKYANSGSNDKNLMNFDSDYCSSQESSTTENGEPDDSSTNTKSSSSSNKIKFFGKLRKLVLGKETNSKRGSSSGTSPTNHLNLGRRTSVSNSSLDDAVGGRYSCDGLDSLIAMGHAPVDHMKIIHEKAAQDQNKTSWSETSLDKQKLKMSSAEEERGARAARCKSDLGSTVAYKRFVLGDQSRLDSYLSEQDSHEHLDPPEKKEMKKFADILKGNRRSLRIHQRSASYNA